MAIAPTWHGPIRFTSPPPAFNATGIGTGYWSGDGGKTWATFARLPQGAAQNPGGESSIAVTTRNKAIRAAGNPVPSFTSNSGATWTATNLPALASIGGSRS